MARLVRAVRKHAVAEHGRLEHRRDQNRGAGNETIDDDQAAQRRCLQRRADHHRDFESAERGQCIERAAGRFVTRENAAQHIELAAQAGVVEPGASACAHGDVAAGEPRKQQRGGRRVADAHLAEQQHVSRQRGDDLAAGLDRTFALLDRHRRAQRRVGRAVADLAHDQPRPRLEVVTHAGVDDMQRERMLLGEHADCSAASEEVLDHLPGHVARVRRHTLRRQAMVGREHQHLRCGEARVVAALDEPDLHGERFDAAERPDRLRQPVDPLPQAARERCIVDRVNGRELDHW